MKEIYIIRHGQTLYNLQNRVQGKKIDSSLNESGLAESQSFYEKYKDIPFELVISSALNRTIETVLPFINTGIPHLQLEDLNEISWGIHEGMKISDKLYQEHQTLIANWGNENYAYCIEDGENALDMDKRLRSFIQQLLARPEQQILVCTHGGCMAFLMTILQQEPLSQMPKYKHQNTGLCKFDFDGTNFHLQLHDDISHLT